MNFSLLILIAVASQSTKVDPVDPVIHRPIIPDYMLIRQEWAKEDLGLSPADRESLLRESNVITTHPIERWFAKVPSTSALNQRHFKRLFELSLWESGEFAVANSGVSAALQLSQTQRNQVDNILRNLYGWYEAETRRLNQAPPNDLRGSFRMDSSPVKRPNEHLVLKQTMVARAELRKVLTPSQTRMLTHLKGTAPHTPVPFGFPFNIRPLPQVPWGVNYGFAIIPRVQEELGFSMQQAREWKERVEQNRPNSNEVMMALRKSLSAQQLRRLRELQLQVWGPRAILFQDIRHELEIVPDSMDRFYIRMQELYLANQERENRFQSQMAISLRENRENREERRLLEAQNREARREYQRELDSAASDAMSSSQRQRLQSMKGRIVSNLLPAWAGD